MEEDIRSIQIRISFSNNACIAREQFLIFLLLQASYVEDIKHALDEVISVVKICFVSLLSYV